MRQPRGAALVVITAVGMAAMNLMVATGSRQVSPLMAIWVPWLLMGAASLLFIWRDGRLRYLFREGLRFRRLVLGMGVIDTLAWLLYATAVAKNGLAITTAITESYPAVALFLGVFVNREKIAKHQSGRQLPSSRACCSVYCRRIGLKAFKTYRRL